MVAVDHLLATLKTATSASLGPASAPAPTTSGVAAATTAAPDAMSLRREVDRAAALAETVRRQTIAHGSRKAADGDGEAGGSGGGSGKKKPASCFCWSDGVLVEALERGDWVVLDGANLCSAR